MFKVNGGMQSQQKERERELISSVGEKGTMSGGGGGDEEFKLSQHAECSVNRKDGIDREKGGEMASKRQDKTGRFWCLCVCAYVCACVGVHTFACFTRSVSTAVSMILTL